MTARKRRSLTDWLDLLATSGLAALITGALGYFGVTVTQSRERAAQPCLLAAQFLQDETLTPYMDERTRHRLVTRAAQTFQRCLEEDR